MTTEAQPVRVSVADWRVATRGEMLLTSGLGSCVAIAVHDEEQTLGGLLHAMLPEAPSDVDKPAKYVDTGLEELLDALEAEGANRESLSAKLVGGSSMLDISVGDAVGERNVDAAIDALDDTAVPLAGAETGGNIGRSVTFSPTTGDLTIDKVDSEVEVL
jgi:chemotaxis protein CheD